MIVGIVNHEGEPMTYRVEVTIDGEKNNEVAPVEMEPEEEREVEVNFIPTKVGAEQKVEFVLYKEGKPYLEPLHLWINVEAHE